MLCLALLAAALQCSAQTVVSSPAPSPAAWSWIWAPDGSKPPETLYFRKSFRLAHKPLHAYLYITADQTFSAYINAVSQPVATGHDYASVQKFEVGRWLHAGRNLLAVQCANNSSQGGLLFKLVVQETRTRQVSIFSDSTVRVNRNPPLRWRSPALNESKWPAAAVLAPAGGGVWGALHGALFTNYARIVRIWNISAGLQNGANPYTAARQQGSRMLLSASVGTPAEMRILKSEGFTLFQTDANPLSTEETAPGYWDWNRAENAFHYVKNYGLDWSYSEQEAFPAAWYYNQHPYTRLECTEHNQTVDAFSLWDPQWPSFIEKGYKQLRKQFGPVKNPDGSLTHPLSAIVVGVSGEYGNVGTLTGLRILNPLQRAEWLKRFGSLHDHEGFWCADTKAMRSFRKTMMNQYKTLDALNAAWHTSYQSPDDIVYPDPVNQEPDDNGRQHYLDFIQWYRASVGHAMEMNLTAARQNFPHTMLSVTADFPDENLRGGNDNSLIPKLAARYNAAVRSMHGSFKPFADDAATMLGRLGSACRFYGAPFWIAPSSDTTPDQTVQRIYEALSQGAAGIFDWASNAASAGNQNVYYQYNRLLRVDRPVVDVAVFYPAMAQEIRPQQGYDTLFARECARLRDLADFDIVDDRMVDDGCLSSYRVLILWQGTICTPQTLAAIKQWVNSGGVLAAYDFGKVTTFTNSNAWFKDLFGYVQQLNPAQVTQRYAGTLPAAYRMGVGEPQQSSYLSGAWSAPLVTGSDLRRWAGAAADITLPLNAAHRYVLTIHAILPPQAQGMQHLVQLNGVTLGSIDSTGDLRYRFVIPQHVMQQNDDQGIHLYTLTFKNQTFPAPAGENGMPAGTPMGVEIQSIALRETSAEPSAAALPGVLQQHLNLSLLTSTTSDQSWVRRYGQGLTVYFPATRTLMKGYLAVLNQIIYHLSDIDPTRHNALPIDGADNGVYATLFPDKILYYNSTNEPVALHVDIPAALFSQWKGVVDTPSQNSWTLTLPPNSIHGIYFDVQPQELLYECEGFTTPGRWKTQSSPDCSPGSGPDCVWVGGGGSITTHIQIAASANFKVYVRALHGSTLVPASVLVDGAALTGSNTPAGNTLLAGSVQLQQGTHTLTLQAPAGEAMRADFVLLSSDADVSGYRFALSTVPISTQDAAP